MAHVYQNRSNANAIVTLAAQGSGTVNSPDMDGSRGRGLLVFINLTGLTGTGPTVTVTVQGKDDVSGTYYTILASTAIAATGFTVLRIYPGLTAAANATANDVLPVTFRVSVAVAGTTPSATGTVATEVLG